MKGREEKKLEERVKMLRHFGQKVYRYRRDILAVDSLQTLSQRMRSLETLRLEWSASGGDESLRKRLEIQAEATHQFLKKIGGKIYPLHFWNENIEVMLVAAIVAIGIRSFFIQPFRIPTNSMFPSFSGMRTEVYQNADDRPSFFSRTLKWFKEGARFYETVSPDTGTLRIPLFRPTDPLAKMGRIQFTPVYGREIFGLWLPFLLPKPYRLYTLRVGSRDVSLRLPFEFFGFEETVTEAFFKGFDTFDEILRTQGRSITYSDGKIWLHTDRRWQKDRPLLRFHLLAGDMLFVDRLTYHFRRPRVGESVIFRTRNIPKLGEDKYYIKRLVGTSGDVVGLKGNQLQRNGNAIEGSPVFRLNNEHEGRYPGYRPKGNLDQGQTVEVPEGHLYVLGDNSPASYDSRYWGFVPVREVVGKAVFVLHPFTWRWGRAR
jgi:signal peptidase I